MEEKVTQKEARAAALGELETDLVDERFAALEQNQEVERDLAVLKAQQGLAARPDVDDGQRRR